MTVNGIRRAVREGRAALGTGLRSSHHAAFPGSSRRQASITARSTTNTGFDMETIANLTSWFQATNVSAIVRIHKSFAHLIPGILD
jgi:hypothetical protein